MSSRVKGFRYRRSTRTKQAAAAKESTDEASFDELMAETAPARGRRRSARTAAKSPVKGKSPAKGRKGRTPAKKRKASTDKSPAQPSAKKARKGGKAAGKAAGKGKAEKGKMRKKRVKVVLPDYPKTDAAGVAVPGDGVDAQVRVYGLIKAVVDHELDAVEKCYSEHPDVVTALTTVGSNFVDQVRKLAEDEVDAAEVETVPNPVNSARQHALLELRRMHECYTQELESWASALVTVGATSKQMTAEEVVRRGESAVHKEALQALTGAEEVAEGALEQLDINVSQLGVAVRKGKAAVQAATSVTARLGKEYREQNFASVPSVVDSLRAFGGRAASTTQYGAKGSPKR